MELTKVGDTLRWTPVVGCLGYVLYIDGVRKSNSWDPNKSSWRVGAGSQFRVVALGVEDEGVFPAPIPAPTFGQMLTPPPPPPTHLPEQTVTTWSGLRDLVALGNARIRVKGTIPIPIDWKWTKPTVWVYADNPRVDGFTGGHPKINTSDVWIGVGSGLKITNSPYDGIKLGDGAHATRVVIAESLISGVDDQGILFGSFGASYVWILRNDIGDVGRTDPVTPKADGHCIYTGGYGGVTKFIWVHANIFRPKAFGVQLFPATTDAVVSGNTFIGGVSRGGISYAWADTMRARSVGNLFIDSPAGAFEAQALNVDPSKGNFANDNAALRTPLWESGYVALPGTNNISTTNEAIARGHIVQDTAWLPPYHHDGSLRTRAVVGA